MVLLRKSIPQNYNLKTAAELGVKSDTQELYKINNLGIALVCLVCVFIGCAGSAVLILDAYTDPAKYKNILDFLAALGSLLGGIAGTLAACAALIGVNVWKKQLKYGKHTSLIWSCMESLRGFQHRKMLWSIYAYSYGTHRAESSVQLELEKKALDVALEELSSYFNSLDKIVVKNQWQWANHAGFLKTSIVEIERVLKKYREAPYGELPLCQELAEMNSKLSVDIEFLEAELEKLESQYQ